ncbi:phenoloxidase-activating factor 2-like [Adelges cooleyi]|uniref:phenoloxidase-activating factor 2-like n=1 Tax=Adelges cooleyi TaxID=133065 RepID=UPI00218070D9|nr:phenoloxidase-activating factor 2-like [Adelges cooleyi]
MTSKSTTVVVVILVLTALVSVRAQFDFFQSAIVSMFPSDAEVAVPVSTPPTSKIANTDNDQQNNDCVCVPFNMCPGYESNSDGINLIDVRINLGPCSSYLEVCCNNAVTSTTLPLDQDKGNSNGNGEFQEQVTAQPESGQDYTTTAVYEYNPEYNPPNTTPEYYNTPESSSSSSSSINTGASQQSSDGGNTCGTWNRGGIGFRVVNTVNSESQYAEYPSMVAIFREDRSNSAGNRLFYHCGGSLIKPNVVLTTAHCVIQKDPSTIVVRAGEWDLQTEKEIFMHQDRRASRIVTHNEYYAGGLHNDVALIFIEDPFVLQETVKTICLPQQNQQFDLALCFSSGWGKEVTTNNYTISRRTSEGVTHEVGHYNVSILKKVELPIVPRDICENTLRGTRLGPRFRLHESFICAGGEEGKDTCKGDGGSPLMCPSDDPDILIQAGIVAWGIGCGLHQIPAVYVNVAQFRNWIDTEISATAKK